MHTPAAEEYTALRDQWIREGDGFVLVYSITQRATFERVERFRQQISRVKDSGPSPHHGSSSSSRGRGALSGVPVVLVGNKCDLKDEREVGKDEGAALARKLAVDDFCECSAKDGSNLNRPHEVIVKACTSFSLSLSRSVCSGRMSGG